MTTFDLSEEKQLLWEKERAKRHRARAKARERDRERRLREKYVCLNRVSSRARRSDDLAARLAEIPEDTRNETQIFAGDPLPGRSALDRRRG